ncbi:ribosome small subunit-dependent GTPase A [Streptomyces marispadix]|uniref:Small ribosomal subunit biogenesis GTPase RsgA n=1 Tax=Streptomyces marispadix TaxID=2922868 RepID=A0ABS9T411_9ACTN|nr:ribosome small subunit-dependent GTPase A [Streptomyces marispadix]MCH6163252.1 ribosome small subunit-dependent GTPase A [Streptomyces marispadix]
MNLVSSPASSHPLARYGWDTRVADAFAPYEDEGLVPARVVRVDRGRCDAVTADGIVRASTAPVATDDPTRAVCTGDWAALSVGSEPDSTEPDSTEPDGAGPGIFRPGGPDGSVTGSPGGPRPAGAERAPEVRALLPRRTAFVRSTASNRSEGQVLAANVDVALIAVSLAAELELPRVERFVALAWTSGARPLIVLTKSDLVADPATVAQLAADAAESAPGVDVLTVSAARGEGLEALGAVLAGGTCVLLGQSGAGKSTLANALLGEDVQDVRTVRDSDGKGRHTTTTRDLLPLPEAAGGGVLIDTPGLRGVGLWDAEAGVGSTFSEIEALAEECRFHDCRHESEPDCAVLAAVDDGSLPQRRLESYRKLLRENARIAARTDARLRAEQKRRFKEMSAVGRHNAERKRGPRRKP